MRLTKKVALEVEKVLTTDIKAGVEARDTSLSRFKLVDAYIEKASAKHKEATVGKAVNELGDKTKTRDLEIPICFIQHDTAVASMAATFLGGEPIFAATASREHEDAAAMLTALSQRDQHRLRWRGNLIQCIDDVIKYNICAAQVTWVSKKTTNITTRIPSDSDGGDTRYTGAAETVVYEGNEIKRIDPYNLILDPSVEPHEVHEDGMYAGYAEAMNRMSFERFVANLDPLFIFRDGVTEARKHDATWDIFVDRTFYSDFPVTRDSNDFSGFWGSHLGRTSSSNQPKSSSFEVVTMFLRLIPSDFGIDVANEHSVQVFKVIWANGKLIYLEPSTTGLEYLPIIVGARYYGGRGKKSFVEYITDLQDVATSVTHGTLNSVRRGVSDRALYDPTRISKEVVESPNPVEKIAVTPNAFESELSSAYHPIPFQDTLSPIYNSLMSFTMSLADQTTGQNQSTQGNFIKGNKTLFEFDTIMSNAEGRGQLGKIVLNETFFAPIQEVLKVNYLIYSQNEAIDNGTDQDVVEIDPVMLREYSPNFLMADGVLPSTKIANTEVAMQAIQLMAVDPRMQVEYDVGAIALSILKQQGLTDIESYKRSPEELQQYMAMMQGVPQGQGEPQRRHQEEIQAE